MSAQSSLVLHCRIRPVARMARDTNSELRAARLAALALRAHNCARAHACAERSTANPELQPARTPHALQEAELFSWLHSERLTRLCGAGAPFRPLFHPIPSFLFWNERSTLPTAGKNPP